MDDKQALAHAKLLLNAQIADLDDCWSEGYEASLSAFSESDNPYSLNSKEFHYWQEGWWAATYEEAPAFELVCQNQDKLQALIEQPSPDSKGFDYITLLKRSIQFGSVAVIAAVGLEFADVAMANLSMFEVFAVV